MIRRGKIKSTLQCTFFILVLCCFLSSSHASADTLLVTHNGQNIRSYDAETGQPLGDFLSGQFSNQRFGSFALDPTGRKIFTSSAQGIFVFDAVTGQFIQQFYDYSGGFGVGQIEFLSDGNLVADVRFRVNNSRLTKFNTATGQIENELFLDGGVTDIEIAADGTAYSSVDRGGGNGTSGAVETVIYQIPNDLSSAQPFITGLGDGREFEIADNGNFFVNDSALDALFEFDADGTLVREVTSFVLPLSLTLTDEGTALIGTAMSTGQPSNAIFEIDLQTGQNLGTFITDPNLASPIISEYVSVSTVPEPTGVSLILLASLAIMTKRRRELGIGR